MHHPHPSQYPPFYHGYVTQVPEGDLITLLHDQTGRALAFWNALEATRAEYAYAPGKWTIKEVLGHIVDAERVFSHRLFCFARGEKQPLPGMDQDAFMAEAHFSDRDLAGLIREYKAVRSASLLLLESLKTGDWDRTGTASGGQFTLRAKAYILAGHELHHLAILNERYGVSVT